MLGRLAVRRAGARGRRAVRRRRARTSRRRAGRKPGLVALRRSAGARRRGRRHQRARRARRRAARGWTGSRGCPASSCVISDFRDQEGWAGPLGALRARHSVLAIEVADPREDEMPDVGRLAVVDPETGRLLEVDTSRRGLRERFAALERERRERLVGELRRLRVEHVAPAHRPRLARRAGAGAAVSFVQPLWLLALLVLPAVWLLYRRRRGRAGRFAVRFPAAATLLAAAPGGPRLAPAPARRCWRSPRWRRSPPRWPSRGSRRRVPIDRASIVLVTDHSGSMLATDVDPDAPDRGPAGGQHLRRRAARRRSALGIVTYAGALDAVAGARHRPRR